ncbi:synaptotagmin-7-like isoform X2 [Portunus trituberculatus]|uniref:synaptotagmin-7-like isoform X2 n=1 Tax=Portunus trituberculatus TaxID=210409 RepID=UPI001E1D02A4|nr:synaptotagmin-7-like isoform X2 [Portunus trituberculatus]
MAMSMMKVSALGGKLGGELKSLGGKAGFGGKSGSKGGKNESGGAFGGMMGGFKGLGGKNNTGGKSAGGKSGGNASSSSSSSGLGGKFGGLKGLGGGNKGNSGDGGGGAGGKTGGKTGGGGGGGGSGGGGGLKGFPNLSLGKKNSTTALTKGGVAGGATSSTSGAAASGATAGAGATGGAGAAAGKGEDAADGKDAASRPLVPVNKNLGNVKAEHGGGAHPSNRSLSLVDMYIDTSEPTENVGQIQFSMEYNFNEMTLILRIMQAKELPAKDLSGTSDPYVRVTLLPDKKHKLETKIKRRTLHPKWHETFYFEGFPIQKLQSRVLHLHVFDYDRFSRDDSIGEVHIPLCQVDFSEKNNTFWKALHPLEKNKCGEILTSLMYQPSTSQLTLTVIKCRNLKAKDINGKSDPYVKVWLYFGEKRIEKKKSEVQFCTLNPEFNFSVMFEVPWERIRECQLNVTIMDHDKVGRNEAIGKIMLGKAGSGTSETKHWSDMITKPRQTVVMWHRLKPE